VVSDLTAARKAASGPSPILYVLGVIAVLGGALLAYVRNLKLDDVTMKATSSYVGSDIVEIEGKIGNAGDRPLETVEIYCVFRDAYGQLVLRKRLPIVSLRMGGLKPGETKSFRLPFDELPESWNQAMPQLVIAGVKFS